MACAVSVKIRPGCGIPGITSSSVDLSGRELFVSDSAKGLKGFLKRRQQCRNVKRFSDLHDVDISRAGELSSDGELNAARKLDSYDSCCEIMRTNIFLCRRDLVHCMTST